MTTTATRPRGARARAAIAAKTLRTDRWWFAPLITVDRAQRLGRLRDGPGLHARSGTGSPEYHYLTPFYSPCVTDAVRPRARRSSARFLPGWWIIPYAALTLPFLLLFRLTCYYYRKAYYRSFWLSPPACAVPDGHKTYSGETRFPLIVQNLHRYFFYAAVLISLINTWDAILAFHGTDGLRLRPGQHRSWWSTW